MDPEVLEALGGWLRVAGIVGGLLVVASLIVWLVVGAVLWFVRGTRKAEASPTPDDWYEQLPEDTTPRY